MKKGNKPTKVKHSEVKPADCRADALILDDLSQAPECEPPTVILNDGDGGEIRMWSTAELMETLKPAYLDLSDFVWKMHLWETSKLYLHPPRDRPLWIREFLGYVRDPKTSHNKCYGEMLTHPLLISPYAMVDGKVDLLKTDRALFYKGDLHRPPFAYQADQYCRRTYGCTILDWVNTEARTVSLDGSLPALKPCRSCGSTEGRLDPAKRPHWASIRCGECNQFLAWAPKSLQA